jgi:hypothetical protein
MSEAHAEHALLDLRDGVTESGAQAAPDRDASAREREPTT